MRRSNRFITPRPMTLGMASMDDLYLDPKLIELRSAMLRALRRWQDIRPPLEAVDVDWRLTEEQLQAMKEARTAETAYFQALRWKDRGKEGLLDGDR